MDVGSRIVMQVSGGEQPTSNWQAEVKEGTQ